MLETIKTLCSRGDLNSDLCTLRRVQYQLLKGQRAVETDSVTAGGRREARCLSLEQWNREFEF
jgi:hypothetical protein